MDIRQRCMQSQGQWVQVTTPWGLHRGIVQTVTNNAVLIRVPSGSAPAGVVSLPASDEDRLDVGLAQWAWGRPGPAYAYGPYSPYGPGQPAYGPGYGWRAGAWLFWWLAFAWIFALAFLW